MKCTNPKIQQQSALENSADQEPLKSNVLPRDGTEKKAADQNESVRKLAAIYILRDPRDLSVRYVGKADNPRRRFIKHMSTPCNEGMSRWISELRDAGISPLQEIIEWVKDWQERERFWISFYRTSDGLLNILDGGNGACESRHFTEAVRAKIVASKLGKPRSAETRAKLSISLTGRTLSAEHRAKLSAALRNPSAETRAKMRAAQKNRPALSVETRAKITAANKGRTHSEASRAKMSVAKIGRTRPPHSAETRARMRAAWIVRKQNTINPQP